MFTKILIANRGEIACRIMETARKLGVRTVAIYSDADAKAKHVEMADEAYRIGPPAVAESYLKGDLIIEIALKSGAEAIHPGYGFLSENPDFVESVTAAGLRFIGPSAEAIRAMGLKDAAKTLMEKAGVPVVPGYHGENQDPAFLAGEADQIGYPVLIKARAGGGGKGMRKVDDPKDFAVSLEGAQREGLASFGDATCLIEKWIMTPRHIEIQVFGDDHGNVVHLFERDCSLQRRHQKVIEEAPAPGMTDEMRQAMGDAAIRCAKSVKYSGAGTVEFIVDASDGLRPDRFWFMEMNTRLQVEHPVTEAVTGQDLVEWQLRVASGEVLPLFQDGLTLNGHAFEARIYAEDVPAGFLPATGTLDYLAFSDRARIDSGVRQGDVISPWYDPMIAKLTTHAANRKIALGALKSAIEDTRVSGSVTNLSFLSRLCSSPAFSEGDVDTGLIDRELENLVSESQPEPVFWAISAALSQGAPLRDRLAGLSLWGPLKQGISMEYAGEIRNFSVAFTSPNVVVISEESKEYTLKFKPLPSGNIKVSYGGRQLDIGCVVDNSSVTVFAVGKTMNFSVKPAFSMSEGDGDNANGVVSPMPGLLKFLFVEGGQTVQKGDALVVVEAMKMEHTLNAPRDGVVSDIFAAVGEQVDAGSVLVTLEEADG